MTVENHSADRQPSQSDTPVSTSVRAVVGIGASAGGLKALRAFFATVPPDSGLAYAVVVHLPPSGESHLASLLQPHAGIPIEQVTDMTRLEPNRAYVIPPGRNLNSIDSHLRLTPIETEHRAPIDHFFRTLASTFDELNIDSLDKINISFEVEETFSIEIPDEALGTLHTVADMVDGVTKLTAHPPATAT